VGTSDSGSDFGKVPVPDLNLEPDPEQSYLAVKNFFLLQNLAFLMFEAFHVGSGSKSCMHSGYISANERSCSF
jgi:hypothetical protein